MYRVKTGMYSHPYTAEFNEVVEAMDFADELYNAGFNYVSVLDEQGKTQYTIGHNVPMSAGTRVARQEKGVEYLKARGL